MRAAGRPRAGRVSATSARRLRARTPKWSVLVLAVLFIGPVLIHEPVFGDGAGAIAAGSGVVLGLIISFVASRRRWDPLSVLAALLASHLLFGGAVALPSTTLWGVFPSSETVQRLVLGSYGAWKDLLTLSPPASAYIGPALVPWMTGLICAVLSGMWTMRRGRPILGSMPILVMGVIGIAFGPAGTRPLIWPVLAWFSLLLAWWGASALHGRIDSGQDIVVGRSGTTSATTGSSTTGASRATVHIGRRVLSAVVMISIGVGVAAPVTAVYGPWNSRIVGRDLVDPPLDLRDYPSPLSAFRHYETDLEETTLLSVDGLPEGARIRIAAMDVYDGTTFTMSRAGAHGNNGYLSVGAQLPERPRAEGAKEASVRITAKSLLGPWVPVAGAPTAIRFEGEDADAQQEGLHADLWADTALTTGPQGEREYVIETMIPPQWSDGQLEGVEAARFTGRDDSVPAGVGDLAASIAAKAGTPLGRARAIERHLSENGFFSNEDSADSRPGHRADRLARMIDADELIGDDEQYAALMALMLHSLGINARVVMGVHSSDGAAELRGSDVHAWVEVEFTGVGWAVFDPTPPRDQTPQTEVTKPRSVPRPQVLQPPEPPEEPVELSPSNSEKPADSQDGPQANLPWGLIGGVVGSVVLLIAPIVVVLVLKARRRRRRRRAEPTAALIGSWDELVDLAKDARIDVGANLTRQEAAWAFASRWPDPGAERKGRAGTAGSLETPAQDASPIHGWTMFFEAVPLTVAVARRADIADFSAEGGEVSEAESAWRDVDALAKRLRIGAGPFTRMRRALSLRSLRHGRRSSPGAPVAGFGVSPRVAESMRRIFRRRK